MKKLILAGLVVALVGCGGEPEGTSEVEDSNVKDTAGYKLTVIETDDTNISTDDPRVKELNDRIAKISSQIGMPSDEIADMAYFVSKQVKEKEKLTSVSEMLDVIDTGLKNDSCIDTHEARKCLSEYLAMYATVRIGSNQTHEETLAGFEKIVQFANDPEKMEELNQLVEKTNTQ